MTATVKWLSPHVFMTARPFLFCFGAKCMSGKIIEFKKTDAIDQFEICVAFIDPLFFKTELINNNDFTINEASKILGTGKVKL